MSEVKGQLLGIALVILIFSAISVILAGVFNDTAKSIETSAGKVLDDADKELNPPAGGLYFPPADMHY